MVARRAHNPKVVGSSPAPATIMFGGIAQLARALGSYPRCRRFKSYFRYHSHAEVAELADAQDLKSCGG